MIYTDKAPPTNKSIVLFPYNYSIQSMPASSKRANNCASSPNNYKTVHFTDLEDPGMIFASKHSFTLEQKTKKTFRVSMLRPIPWNPPVWKPEDYSHANRILEGLAPRPRCWNNLFQPTWDAPQKKMILGNVSMKIWIYLGHPKFHFRIFGKSTVVIGMVLPFEVVAALCVSFSPKFFSSFISSNIMELCQLPSFQGNVLWRLPLLQWSVMDE